MENYNEVEFWHTSKNMKYVFIVLWIPITAFILFVLSGIYKTAQSKGTDEFGTLAIISAIYLFFTLLFITMFVFNYRYVVSREKIEKYNRKGELLQRNYWSEEYKYNISSMGRGGEILIIKFEGGNSYSIPWTRRIRKELSVLANIKVTTGMDILCGIIIALFCGMVVVSIISMIASNFF